MFDAFASVALEILRDVLIGEAKFLPIVDVEEVQRQLKTMHCFLRGADRREDKYNTETVCNWLRELQNLADQAEDVLERYVVQVTSKRERTGLKKVLNTFTSISYEFSARKEIENIMSRMAYLTQSLESITKGESSSSSIDDTQLWSRKTYGHEVEEHFVGMKDDIKVLEILVTSDDRSDKVISICGMGGLGKTTLATKIYNGEVVRRCFEARAWVCVSQQFQPKVVFQGLLNQLVPNQREVEDENELVRKLYQVQLEKKCLVVLDDIWEVDHWNILSRVFPIGEACCKVVLTSRNEKIAATEYVHKLECLSEEEGWQLLQRIALPINYSPDLITTESKLLEDEGKEIVRKCGCLPLAISIIGGILRQKKSSSEWEKVKKNIDSYLKRGEGVGKDKRIMQILDLSYNVLPYNLKPCFLYLGCFQEDRDIETKQLYLLWMAEGMISSKNKGRGETLRDVAERYLCELENRCMIQVKVDEYSIHNRFESCRLHDLMRDLCLSKGKEEEFVQVVDKQIQTEDIGSSLGRTRRLAVHKEKLEDLQFVYGRRNRNLRSLLLLENTYSDIQKIVSIDFGMFTSLKILILEGCEFKNRKLPEGIEKLILLKHLSLYGSKVEALPPSIRKLPCLQSLNLRTPYHMKLPSVIHSTGRLRHLLLPESITSIVGGGKLKLDGLNELETLSGFNSEFMDFSHIHKLVNLRELNGDICDEESLSTIVHHILDHQDQFRKTFFEINGSCPMNSEQGSILLRKMLMCHSLVKLQIYCRVRKLPAYEPHLCRNLIYLTLDDCRMEEDPMKTLEKLPMLRELEMDKDVFVGREMVCRAAGFPQLRNLELWGLTNLVEWRVEEKAMPNLSSLDIGRCKKLKMIPEGLRFITTLQEITISYMPKEFKDRIRIVDGEDYDKIKHIPSVRFWKVVGY